jgi:hypothetical protein
VLLDLLQVIYNFENPSFMVYYIDSVSIGFLDLFCNNEV